MNYNFLYPELISEAPWEEEEEEARLEAERIAEWERSMKPTQPLEYIPIEEPTRPIEHTQFVEQPVVQPVVQPIYNDEQEVLTTDPVSPTVVLDTLAGTEPQPTKSRIYDIHEPVDFRAKQDRIGFSPEPISQTGSTYTPTDFSKVGSATDIFNKVYPTIDVPSISVPKANVVKRNPTNKTSVAKTQKKPKVVNQAKTAKPQFTITPTISIGPNGVINANHRTLQFANPDADYARLYALKEARAREALARANISREVALANAMRGR